MTPVERYFEDYEPGSVWPLGEVSAGEAEMVEFAGRYDPQYFHTDPVAALDGPFGGLIASGWHTCVLAMQRFVPGYLSPASSLGAPAIDDLRFPAPVRPGERLAVSATVLDARVSASRPDRGVVRTQVQAVDAAGTLVLTMVIVHFVLRRATVDASAG